VLSPKQVFTGMTGTHNDYAINDTTEWARFVLSADTTITGLDTQHKDGRLLLIMNGTGQYTLTLAQNDTGSSATNRFVCPNEADFAIRKRGAIFCVYDTYIARWSVIDP